MLEEQSAVDSEIIPEHSRWCAVFTAPRSEKAVSRHFGEREIESFLPLYETIRLWKNRQKVRVSLPLFPGYVFVHMDRQHRSAVLQTPGVIYVVGSDRQSEISDKEIRLLREASTQATFEPYRELVIGERVRIKSGALQGVEGVLVRKQDSLRFVLKVHMINQCAALEVSADQIEAVTEHVQRPSRALSATWSRGHQQCV